MYSIIQNGTRETASEDIESSTEWRIPSWHSARTKTSQTLGEDVVTTTSLKEGFSTTKHALEKRLQQAQTNSQELQNGGCVSGVRRKRRGPGIMPIVQQSHSQANYI